MKRVAFLAVLLSAAPLSRLARAEEIPPAPQKPVTDNARCFNPTYAEMTEAEIRRWQDATRHPILVWTQKSLGGADPEVWCRETFERWRVERPNLDNGAAIFIFPEDGKLRVEIGPRLREILPEGAEDALDHVIEEVRRTEKNPSDWNNPILWNIYALSDLQKWLGKIPPEPPPPLLVEEAQRKHATFWERRADEFERDPGLTGLLAFIIIVFVVMLVTHPVMTLGMVFFNLAGGILGESSSGLVRAAGSVFSGAGGSFGGGGASGKW
jgi:uncharacterized protein